MKKKSKVENEEIQSVGYLAENPVPAPEIDEVPVDNLERANYYQMKILCSQAEEAGEKTKLIQERKKIDQILGFYQIQEAMAKAKSAGYKSKASDPVYNLEI